MPIDVYERITARILQQLEEGTVPWHKPWKGGETGHPRNLVSGHRYRGINIFLLTSAPFESHFWLTFKQAKQLGGSVRKGEESTPVVFWKFIDKESPDTGETERFPLLRHYNAFNIEQCDLPSDKLPEVVTLADNNFEPIEVCERTVTEMPDAPEIHAGGGVACYRPASDSVHIPKPKRFESPSAYYSTLFHELTHSTGHSSRLNRPGIVGSIQFGSEKYSKEELIAEMGAAFLCGHCGIENAVVDSSAAYIAGWLQRLRDDKRLVVHAAAAAQKAADFILGRQQDAQDEEAVVTTASNGGVA